MRIISLLLLVFFCFVAPGVASEDEHAGVAADILYENLPDNVSAVGSSVRFEQQFAMKKLETEKDYVLILATLSVVSLLVVLFLMRGSSPTAEDVVLVMGLNFVIFGTIISVLIVSTSEQLSAITGILGAMGGYLFGSKGRKNLERRIGEKRSYRKDD